VLSPPRRRKTRQEKLAKKKPAKKKFAKKNLPRRANHLHMFIIARIEPAPGNRSRAF
jgi:hypothetical protein